VHEPRLWQDNGWTARVIKNNDDDGWAVEMVKAVTGWDVTVDELLEVGLRRINMMRTFNAREGFTRAEDAMPAKFFKPLQGTGPTAGIAIDKKEFEAALDEYYKLAGWTKDGIPTAAALKKLDIGWAANYLPA
jgi:aldehyde:ferredoxin oxidoreductase